MLSNEGIHLQWTGIHPSVGRRLRHSTGIPVDSASYWMVSCLNQAIRRVGASHGSTLRTHWLHRTVSHFASLLLCHPKPGKLSLAGPRNRMLQCSGHHRILRSVHPQHWPEMHTSYKLACNWRVQRGYVSASHLVGCTRFRRSIRRSLTAG